MSAWSDAVVLDTALSYEARNKLGVTGVLPPAVDSPETQIERCLARIKAKKENLDKYLPGYMPSGC